MATFTIFYGDAKPTKAVGKNQCEILDFAYRNRCWHLMEDDRGSRKAYEALLRKGLIEIKDLGMMGLDGVKGLSYRFKYPNE